MTNILPEIYDHEIIEIEKVLQALNERTEKPLDYDAFDRYRYYGAAARAENRGGPAPRPAGRGARRGGARGSGSVDVGR